MVKSLNKLLARKPERGLEEMDKGKGAEIQK